MRPNVAVVPRAMAPRRCKSEPAGLLRVLAMIAGTLVRITRQMSCVDASRYAPSAPPDILDSSVNRALHALPTGSNLRRFEFSIAHRRSLLSTGSTTKTSRTVPSVITVSSKTTMPTGGVATINFGGVRHLSTDSSPWAITPPAQLRSKAPNSSSLARITFRVSREHRSLRVERTTCASSTWLL